MEENCQYEDTGKSMITIMVVMIIVAIKCFKGLKKGKCRPLI